MRRVLFAIGLVLAAGAAWAQNYPNPIAQSTTLTSATCPGTGCLTMTVADYGTVGIQLTGTWSGTVSFLGSIDQVNFSAINCTPPNGSSAVTTTTGNGTWTCSVAGLTQAQVQFSTATSGSVVVTMEAAPGGGSAGGGGSSSSVTIQDPTTSSQKAAVNASGQLSITCANCSGSGASAVDNSTFTAGASSGAPAMGFFQTTPSTVTAGDTATIGMDSKRQLYTVLRDAALGLRGANVTAGNALQVDASATTQPISAASLPLPSGASTAAKQPALGTAGSASADVISVQGVASMTALKVDGSGVTQPVSGTVAATESGTWTVQPGNTANTTAWKVDGSAVTQPVSGTFWQTTQPVSGTVTANAGTNLNTSALALNTSVTGLQVGQGSTTSGQNGDLVQGAVTTGAPTYTTAQTSPLSLTTAGGLRVDGSAVTQPVSGTFWQATQPVSGTVTANAGTNLNTSALATSANQTNASQKTQIVDGSGNVIASTSNNLNVQCANCSGSGASAVDNASVTESTSVFAPVGGEFQTTPGTVTAGHQAMAAITAHRAVQISPFDTAGASLVNADGGVNSHITNSSPTATADAVSGVPYVQQTAAHSQTVTLQAAATANGNGSTLPTLGESTAMLTVNCASCSGGTTINFEVSEDNTNYQAVSALVIGTSTLATTTSTSGIQLWEVPVSGSQVLRARISAYSAGTVTVTGHTVPVVSPNRVVAVGANSSVNVAQVNGVTVLTGTGASGTGAQRMVDVASSSTGSAPPAQASFIGGIQSGATGGFLGGASFCDTSKVVNVSTATTTLLITGVASRQVHICSFHLLAGAADNVAIIEGTGATCGTGSAGMAGGTTAASGYNFAANGGIALGSGMGDVMETATAGDSVCVVTSAAAQLSGHIRYAIY